LRHFLDPEIKNAQLWIKANTEAQPSLIARYQDIANLVDVRNNRNSSSVMLVRVNGRVFAECTGLGHAFLEKHRLANDFGTVLTTRFGNPDQIRAVGTRILGLNHGSSKISQKNGSAVYAMLPNTEMFSVQMLLAAPDGKIPDELFRTKAVEGSIGYLETARFSNIEERIQRFGRYLAEYCLGSRLPESVLLSQPVHIPKDDQIAEALYSNLLAEVIEGNTAGRVEFCIPYRLNYENGLEGMQVRIGSAYLDPADVDWTTLVSAMGRLDNLTVDRLERKRVHFFSDGFEVDSASLLACLHYEQVIDDESYCHDETGWTRISKEFIGSIERRIDEHEETFDRLGLEPWKAGWDEGAYNQNMGGLSNWCCMHPALWYRDGMSGGVELADLVGCNGELVHTKEYTGGQFVSHLVYQAKNAALVLAHQPAAMSWLDTHGQNLNPLFDQQRKRIVIALGIRRNIRVSSIGSSGSKIAIARTLTYLSQAGFHPSICKIPIL
jgi:uncharacterized protein (TIGR04141 family)